MDPLVIWKAADSKPWDLLLHAHPVSVWLWPPHHKQVGMQNPGAKTNPDLEIFEMLGLMVQMGAGILGEFRHLPSWPCWSLGCFLQKSYMHPWRRWCGIISPKEFKPQWKKCYTLVFWSPDNLSHWQKSLHSWSFLRDQINLFWLVWIDLILVWDPPFWLCFLCCHSKKKTKWM